MTQTIHLKIAIGKPAGAVYAALTEERQVTAWLCESARIDLPAGLYELAGPSIPGVPKPGSGHMELLDFDGGACLSFRWLLLGDETLATFTLSPSDAGTQVAIEHAGVADQERGWAIASFWHTLAENLRAWVERGVVGPRFDYRELLPGDIEVAVEIDAPPAAVFRAIADPELVGRWMKSDSVTIEPEIGGVYDVGWEDDGPMRIVDLETDAQLSYSWRSQFVQYETLVTWELAESAGRTRLTLVHSGFAPDESFDPYRTGWHDFLVQIKYLVEQGDAWQPPELEMVEAVGSL